MSSVPTPAYAIYLSEAAVEVYFEEQPGGATQPFSREKNYYNAVDFGRDLAAYKRVPFINHAQVGQREGSKLNQRSAQVDSVSAKVVCVCPR